jgi:hypothetical protein
MPALKYECRPEYLTLSQDKTKFSEMRAGRAEKTFKDTLKPYIRGNFPVCPVGDKRDDSVNFTGGDAMAGDDGSAWKFNTKDGRFICNSTAKSKVPDPADPSGNTMLTYDKF